MKNKIIFLIWPSWSWKTTIENLFLEQDSKNYWEFLHIVSHATRKRRVGEKEWVDYYFIDDAEFDNMFMNNLFIQTVNHAWARKWSSLNEWINKLNKWNVIMPVLLSSTLELKKNLTIIDENINDNIHIIYFNIEKETVLNRMLNRYSVETEYTIDELKYMYLNNINNNDEKIENIFKEIDERLKDVEMLSDTINYTDNIIHINDDSSIDDVYSDFIEIINKIFSK